MKKIKPINLNNIFFLFLLLVLVNGRSFLGIFLFGFRIGELLTGVCLLTYLIVFLRYKYFLKHIDKNFLVSNFILLIFFITFFVTEGYDITNLYIFKSSVYIWYISMFYLGLLLFSNFEINKNYFLIGYVGLLLQYIFNVLYYPEFMKIFFQTYSDKVQFLKGSELGILFIVLTFFSNKFKKHDYYLHIFLLFSSIYLPLTIFKSRSAGIAIAVYIIIEILRYREIFLSNIKRTITVIIFSILLFSFTSHNLVDNTFELDETTQAITQVFKHKYVVSNTFDDEVPLFYFYDGRMFSADGNLNWRLQLWQDVVIDSIESNYVFKGLGFAKTIPVFDDFIYSGVDGLNENTHNYFLNVYARTGLLGLAALFYFWINLLQQKLSLFSKSDLYLFLAPLIFISMFDGSMENPYFGLLIYFFLSSFVTGIKFTNKEY
tara:strand:- start:15177 stop:16472 length:1296 start_codon:yes stop_codon:yes gene_type:complete